MREIDVSIIIPVYNVEDYVAECLQSVMAQTADCTMECIVVDDRGSDDSMAVVKRTIAEYNGPVEFRIITREVNGGLSAARNTGIRAARGRYVYFLDSDDLITEDCMAEMLNCAGRHPKAEIITGDFQTFPEKDVYKDSSIRSKHYPEYSEEITWIRSVFLTEFPVIACNKLILKTFILNNNLFFREGILHEDNHWHANAYHHIRSIAFVFSVTYLYRQRPGSITLTKNASRRKMENLGKIYVEIFAKEVKWDQSWARFIFYCLNDMKYWGFFREEPEIADRIYNSCLPKLLKNPTIPIGLRLIFKYQSLGRPWVRFRLLKRAFNLYVSHLPK